MHTRLFVTRFAGLLTTCTVVVAKNDFIAGFPKFFSFNSTTQFNWGDDQQTDLTGLFVVGNTNTSERYPLPLDPSGCKNATIISGVAICNQWINNGTATFGGPYAVKLVLEREYHFVLAYVFQDQSSRSESSSPVFRMLNPILPLSSSTQPTSSLPRSTTTASPKSTTTNTPTPTPSPPSSTPRGDKGLTPGATAGLTVGIIAAVVFIFFLALSLRRRRQAIVQKKKYQDAHRGTTGTHYQDTDIRLGSPATHQSAAEGGAGWQRRNLPPWAVPPGPTRHETLLRQHLSGAPF